MDFNSRIGQKGCDSCSQNGCVFRVHRRQKQLDHILMLRRNEISGMTLSSLLKTKDNTQGIDSYPQRLYASAIFDLMRCLRVPIIPINDVSTQPATVNVVAFTHVSPFPQ